jgi:hypothetical protein
MVAQRLAKDGKDRTAKRTSADQNNNSSPERVMKRSKPRTAAVSPIVSPVSLVPTVPTDSEPSSPLATGANPLQMVMFQQMMAMRQMQMLTMMQASAGMMNPLLMGHALARGQPTLWPMALATPDSSQDSSQDSLKR